MEDTRSDARKRYADRLLNNGLMKRLELDSFTPLIKIVGCLLFAIVIYQLPPVSDAEITLEATAGGAATAAVIDSASTLPPNSLTEAGRWTLFILTFAAGLWATEAIPAFAVALLVIGMQIVILGKPWVATAEGSPGWEVFAASLGSPLIWLFFGGFVLAAAAEKTGLNRGIASEVIRRLGTRPGPLLAGSMGVTFVFSMFISNTAAATMMLAVMLPVVGSLGSQDRFRKAMVLGIAFAANLGGMGTVIGSPPNAIAVGALAEVQPVDFFHWVVAAAPPAVVMVILTWAYLLFRYRSDVRELDLAAFAGAGLPHRLPVWRRYLVALVFCVTVLLWLTTSLHGVPSTVVAFVPICVLCVCGVIDSDDICEIRWDVLLLIAGGLSLGFAVTHTGLATWLVGLLPMERFSSLAVILLLAYATMALSNVMSNTAAANILVPIGLVVGAGSEAATVIPLAIGASAAMCLPISTPPNAIAYGTGQVTSKDMIEGGIWIGLLAPLLAALWCQIVL